MMRNELPRELEGALADVLFRHRPPHGARIEELARRYPQHALAILGRASDLGFEVPHPDGSTGIPTEIGPYRIRRQIGEGGFGIVYLAEQLDPVRKKVALKVLKPGLDSRSILGKFRQEARVLAAMDHEFIATMRNSGQTDQGQVYFAMDLIDGESLASYSARNELSVRQWVELVRKVCLGVQHAHQKTVIHGDLTPANILVVESEGEPTPKIIDFGLARALDPDLAGASAASVYGERGGTLPYMSPEQLAPHLVLGPGQATDTRTDVYSLGIILYQLLVGQAPFPTADGPANRRELERQIVEDTPPRPSARVRGRAEYQRRMEKDLRGDLDWVVLRALEKNPGRRYATPMEMARDIERYLRFQPVEARPPSRLYQIQKFVRRHRMIVATAGALLFVIVAGSGLLTWQQRRIAEERGEKLHVQTAKIRAERAAARELEQVAKFQETRFQSIDPEAMGVDIRHGVIAKAREAWTRAGLDEVDIEQREQQFTALIEGANTTDVGLEVFQEHVFEPALEAIDADFEDQPLVRARLLLAVGNAQYQLGFLKEASAPLREAFDIRRDVLGEEDPLTLTSMNVLGLLRMDQRDLAGAHELFERSLEARRNTLGDEHADTLTSIHNLVMVRALQGDLSGARELLEDVLEVRVRVLGDGHPDTLASMNNLAAVRNEEGDSGGSRELIERVLRVRRRVLRDDHPDTLISMHNLAVLRIDDGDLVGARELLETVLEAQRRVLGDDHPDTLASMHDLARVLQDQGDSEGARDLFETVLEAQYRVLGDEHPHVLITMNNLAVLRGDQGDRAGSCELLETILVVKRRVHGEDGLETLSSMYNLALAYFEDEWDLTRAGELLEAAMEKQHRVLGGDHRDTLRSMSSLAGVRDADGDIAGACELLETALEVQRRAIGADDPDTLLTMKNLGGLRAVRGDYDGACEITEALLAARRRLLGGDDPDTLSAMNDLGVVWYLQGELDEASELLEAALEARIRVLGDDDPDTLTSMNNLAAVRAKLCDYDGARRLWGAVLLGYRKVWGDESQQAHRVRKRLKELDQAAKSAGDRTTDG